MSLFAMLSPHLSSAIAIAGLSRMNPQLQKFIAYGTAAGYGTDEILSFLREKMESQGYTALKGKLESGAREGTLRPDEMATRERIRQEELAPDIAQGALSTAAGLSGGLLGRGRIPPQTGGAVSPSQILPALPQAAQLAGPANAPQIGMAQRGFTMRPSAPTPQGPIAGAAPPPQAQIAMAAKPGSSQAARGVTQANQLPPSEPTPKMAKGAKAKAAAIPPNDPFEFLQQHDPNLAAYIEGQLSQGRNPTQAAALAKHIGHFSKPISSIEKKTKTNFVDLISQLFGSPTVGQPANQQMMLPLQTPVQQRQQPQGQAHPELVKMLQAGMEWMRNYRPQ